MPGAREHIAQLISKRSTQIKPGGRLPTTAELAREFGTSLVTANQAVKLLVERNVLKTVTGKGIFVADPTEDISEAATAAGIGFPFVAAPNALKLRLYAGHLSHLDRRMWKHLGEAFARNHPGVALELMEPDEDPSKAHILMPDHLLFCRLAESGDLLPLDVFVDKPHVTEDFYPGCFEWQKPLSEWCWAPLFMMTSYCFYDQENLDRLEMAPLRIEADLAELAEYVETASERILKKHLTIAPGWSTIGYAGILMQAGIDLLPKDHCLSTSAEARERWSWCLTQFKRMRQMSTDILTGKGSRQLFYDGGALMMLDHSLKDVLAAERHMTARPIVAANRNFGACGMVIRRNATNRVAAGHLLSWLMSPDAQRIVAGTGGRIPVRRSVFLSAPPELPGGLQPGELSGLLDRQPYRIATQLAHLRLIREVVDLEIQRFLMLDLPVESTVESLILRANHFLAENSVPEYYHQEVTQ